MTPVTSHPPAVLERRLDWADPERVHAALCAQSADSIWLDGGPDATRGMSIMGVPRRVVSVDDPAAALPTLRSLLAEAPRLPAGVTDSTPESTPLGWFGWLSYEVGAAQMGTSRHRAATPAMVLGYLDRAIVFDHAGRGIRVLALDEEGAEAWLSETAEAILGLSPEPITEVPASLLTAHPLRWRHDREEYLERIRECQRLIGEGEVYQVCLCNHAEVAGDFDPVAVHGRLRRRSPSHHGGLFRAGELALLCGSPEQFLSVDAAAHVVTRPMKGTRPRGVDAAHDAALTRELHDSDKERAENVMIVDLMRNDLSRVSAVGSVDVTELFEVESYANVLQLVSTVEATLAEPASIAELLVATLPPGSMTGAPKHSAMTAIDRLEGGARGVFSGVFGRFSLDGTVDLAVVIRSIVITPGQASLGAGGGITALSEPETEYDETMLKAHSMLWALGLEPPAATEAGNP